jgi:hypothetical protein
MRVAPADAACKTMADETLRATILANAGKIGYRLSPQGDHACDRSLPATRWRQGKRES